MLWRLLKLVPAIVLIVSSMICGVTCSKKQKSRSDTLGNDILEKSEVTLKFPVYAIKMPPLVATRRRSNAKVDPVPVSCTSKNVTAAFSELRKKIQCIPRDTVVDVSAPDGSTVSPNTVVVKRCGGMCSGGKKCMPSKKKSVEFFVRTTNIKSDLVFCNSIMVTEDTECKCKCANKKKSCLPVQKFDSNTCKCYCPKTEEYDECIDKVDLNFKWDPKTCSCVCKNVKKCTTGTVWSPGKCRCVKMK